MDDRLAAVSVDLDEIPCYTSIHGIDPPRGDAAHAVYRRALPRFAALFEDLGITATFFVIGRDLDDAHASEGVRSLHRTGHELANHTEGHVYDLTRRDPSALRHEVATCADRLSSLTGRHTRGFRAPGYVMSDALFRVLEDLDVLYDSSVFPCPAYYSVKGLAMGWIRLRGRKTHSVFDDPRVLTAPADPYFVGQPYWRRGTGLLELPIGVTTDATGRLPFIGTSLILGGPAHARRLASMMEGRPLINLELHGIDLADASRDGLGFLAPHQPDLRKALEHKDAALRSAIETLRSAGYRFVTLVEAARILARGRVV